MSPQPLTPKQTEKGLPTHRHDTKPHNVSSPIADESTPNAIQLPKLPSRSHRPLAERLSENISLSEAMQRNRPVPYPVKIVQSGRSDGYESINNIVHLDTLTGHPTGSSEIQVLLLEAYKTTTSPTTPPKIEDHHLSTPSPFSQQLYQSPHPQKCTSPSSSPSSPWPSPLPPLLPNPPLLNNSHPPLPPNHLPPRNNKHRPHPRHLLHRQPPLQRDLPPPTDPRLRRRRHLERVPTGRRRHDNPRGAGAVPVHFGAAGPGAGAGAGVGWVSVAVVVCRGGGRGGEVSLYCSIWVGICWGIGADCREGKGSL